MPNISIKIAVVISTLIIAGCSSRPREVNASLPLVTPTTQTVTGKAIPEKYWSSLSSAGVTTLTHEKYQITLSPLYTSALGNLCRKLTLVDQNKTQMKRIACELSLVNANNQPYKAWFLEKQIIETSSYVEL
ncbi:hypothetical protein [Psychromonas aquatilis]|uniref:Common-antigen outer membrane protein n=1 Tax=Psychromonas aquatilis TaxID=2005072 RepID=A0ABU9GSU5_9GAMM